MKNSDDKIKTMKIKYFISMLFCSYTLISFSQKDSIAKYNVAKMKKWEIGVNINTVEPITEAGFDYIDGGITRLFNPSDLSHQKDKSYSLGLNVSYKVKNDWTIRLSGKLINYKIDETYNYNETVPSQSGNDYLSDDAHFRQTVISIMPGILWGVKYKRLNFYCGFQVQYKHYSAIDFQIRYTDYLTSNNTVLSVQTLYFKQQGGFSIGVGPFVGFSIDVFNGISLGAEFASSYSYYKTGGERTKVTTQNSGAIDNVSFQNSYETYKFSSIISSINLSIKF